MRIEQLEYLVQTANSSSLNKAGEKLHITQQSLNAAIKKLEEELGTNLLDRDYSGIKLNEQGKLALPYMEKILQLVDEMKSVLNSAHPQKISVQLKGNLVIHTTMAANHALIPQAMQHIMEQYEKVSFVLLEKSKEEILQEIDENLPAIGIISHIPEYEGDLKECFHTNIHVERIAVARIYAVVSQTHPLAHQKSVTIRTILKYPIGLTQTNSNPVSVQKILEEKGQPNIQLITNSIQTYRRTIDAGQIIGFNPYMNFRDSLGTRKGVVYLPIRDFPSVEIYLITNNTYFANKKDLITILSHEISEIIN